MSKFNTPKNNKILSNVCKIGGAHLQLVNNHYAKFECKEMKTKGVTDDTNQTAPKHFDWKKGVSSTPLKNEKVLIKCAQKRRCTYSMCEQSLCNVSI